MSNSREVNVSTLQVLGYVIIALFAVQTTLTDVNLVNSKEMENGLNLGIPLVACTFRNGAATVLLRQPPYRRSQLCKTSVCNLHIRNHLHT